jgi:phage baseplate assembly protein V
MLKNNTSCLVTHKSSKITKGKNKVTVDGRSDEELSERLFIEQFGFTSNPPVGSQGLAIMPNCVTENAVIIGLDAPQYKPNLEVGESALYDKNGNKFHLKNGIVEITVKGVLNLNVTGNVNLSSSNLNIDANNVTIDGNLNVNGNSSFNGNVGSSNGAFDIGGSGGQPIARIGDNVQVGDTIGVIISGSNISRSN